MGYLFCYLIHKIKIWLMRFFPNANFSRSQKSQKARTLCNADSFTLSIADEPFYYCPKALSIHQTETNTMCNRQRKYDRIYSIANGKIGHCYARSEIQKFIMYRVSHIEECKVKLLSQIEIRVRNNKNWLFFQFFQF